MQSARDQGNQFFDQRMQSAGFVPPPVQDQQQRQQQQQRNQATNEPRLVEALHP